MKGRQSADSPGMEPHVHDSDRAHGSAASHPGRRRYLGWAGVVAAVVVVGVVERSVFGPGIAPRQAHVKGIVTYRFPGQPRAMVQNDDTAAVVDTSRLGTLQFGPGDRVEFDGPLSESGRTAVVLATRGTSLGAAMLPYAVPLAASDLVTSSHADHFVEIEGIVRSAVVEQRNNGQLARWDLDGDGGRFVALIADDGATDADTVVNARVSVRGVAQTIRTSDGEIVHAQVLVPSRAQVRVLEAPPRDPYAVPVRTVASLATLGRPPYHRIRLQGHVRERADGALILVDDTGEIETDATGADLVAGGRADVLGFVSGDVAHRTIENAVIRSAVDAPETAGQTPRSTQLLTTVAEVHGLPALAAKERYPVRLRGVVTYYDQPWSNLFIQDASGGIYVHADIPNPPRLATGDLVEIDGFSARGGFAPMVVEPKIRVVGRGVLPMPQRVPFDQLLSGHFDSAWVEADGLVQSVGLADGDIHIALTLVSGSHKYPVGRTEEAGCGAADESGGRPLCAYAVSAAPSSTIAGNSSASSSWCRRSIRPRFSTRSRATRSRCRCDRAQGCWSSVSRRIRLH